MALITAKNVLVLIVALLLAFHTIAQAHPEPLKSALEARNTRTRTRTRIIKASEALHVRQNPPSIQARDESEGADCSPEGQWNCMPDTWQRCAAGKWSQVMDLAEGTICTPEGLTEDITIEHDGSVNGGDSGGDDSGNDGGDTFSGGARHGIAAGFAVAAGAFALL